MTSAVEMATIASSLFTQAHLTLFAAAVADYRPAKLSENKLSRIDTPNMQLNFVANPDIAALLGQENDPTKSRSDLRYTTSMPRLMQPESLRKKTRWDCD